MKWEGERMQSMWSQRPDAVTYFLGDPVKSPSVFRREPQCSRSEEVGPAKAGACRLQIWGRQGKFLQC